MTGLIENMLERDSYHLCEAHFGSDGGWRWTCAGCGARVEARPDSPIARAGLDKLKPISGHCPACKERQMVYAKGALGLTRKQRRAAAASIRAQKKTIARDRMASDATE